MTPPRRTPRTPYGPRVTDVFAAPESARPPAREPRVGGVVRHHHWLLLPVAACALALIALRVVDHRGWEVVVGPVGGGQMTLALVIVGLVTGGGWFFARTREAGVPMLLAVLTWGAAVVLLVWAAVWASGTSYHHQHQEAGGDGPTSVLRVTSWYHASPALLVGDGVLFRSVADLPMTDDLQAFDEGRYAVWRADSGGTVVSYPRAVGEPWVQVTVGDGCTEPGSAEACDVSVSAPPPPRPPAPPR